MVRAILRLIAVLLATVGALIIAFAVVGVSQEPNSSVFGAFLIAVGVFFLGLAAWFWTLKRD